MPHCLQKYSNAHITYHTTSIRLSSTTANASKHPRTSTTMASIGRYITSSNPSYTHARSSSGQSNMNSQVDMHATAHDLATPAASEAGRSPRRDSHTHSDTELPRQSPTPQPKQPQQAEIHFGKEPQHEQNKARPARKRDSESAHPPFIIV